MADLPDGQYTLKLRVTNFFNNNDETAPFTFEKTQTATAPNVAIVKPAIDKFTPAGGVQLTAILAPETLCPGKTVELAWSCSNCPAGLISERMASRSSFRIPGPLQDITAATAYTFAVTARYTDATAGVESTDSVALIAASTPLRADLRGPSGDVRADAEFILDASRSNDPDDPTDATEPMRYEWSVRREDFPEPAFGNAAYAGFKNGSRWTINATTGDMAFDKWYTFSVTVAKGTINTPTYRSATSSILVRRRSGATPTGRIVRWCGVSLLDGQPVSCPAKHNPSSALSLLLYPDAGFETARVSRWYTPAGSALTLDASNSKGLNDMSLTIPPAALRSAGGRLTISVDMSKDNAVGTASMTVAINSPPTCAGTCFSLDRTTAIFPASAFLASAAGWSDPDGDALTYEYGTLRAGRYTPMFTAPSNSYQFSGFAAGTYSLYVCALDAFGARACQSADVVVSAPATLSSEDVTAAISTINLDSVKAAAGDSKVAADAARQMSAVLSTLSSSSNAGTVDATVQAELQAKKESLLEVLQASSSGTSDPQESRALLQSSVQLATAGAQLSTTAAAAVLQVSSNAIKANLQADAGFDEVTATSAASAVRVGVQASTRSRTSAAAGSAAAAAGRRRLQQASSDAAATTEAMSPAVAFGTLTSAAKDIGTLLAKEAAPGQAAKVAGDASLCIAVARERARAMDGLKISFAGCSSSAAGARRRLLAGEAPTASVELASNYSTWCAADSACNSAPTADITPTYYADPASFTALIPTFPNLTESSAYTVVTAVTGVVDVALSGAAERGYFCSAAYACPATIVLPILSPANASTNPITACYRLDSATAESLAARTTDVTTGEVNATSVTCYGTKPGKYMAVRYTAVASPPAAPAPPPAAAAAPVPVGNNTQAAATSSYSDDASSISGYLKLELSFTFQLDFNAMFYPGGKLNQSAMDAFKLYARKSLITNLAANSKLVLTNTDGSFQLARVQVTNIKAGSIIMDVTFLAPVGATQEDLDTLADKVVANPALFFRGTFTEAYGAVTITAEKEEGNKWTDVQWLLDELWARQRALVAAVAVLGALVLVSIITCVAVCIRRRRAAGVLMGAPNGSMVTVSPTASRTGPQSNWVP